MKSSFRYIHVALAALLAFALVGCGAVQNESLFAQEESAEITQEAEGVEGSGDESAEVPMLSDFDAVVYTEDNKQAALTEIANGKPLVINYWATWCPYCVEELPDFLDVYRDYQDKVPFAFVDCTDSNNETVENVTQWLFDNELYELPVYYDLEKNAQNAHGVYAYPTTLVVSGDGTITTIVSGTIDSAELRAELDAVL